MVSHAPDRVTDTNIFPTKRWGPFASSGGYHMVSHAPDRVTDTNIRPKIKPCGQACPRPCHRHKHSSQNQAMWSGMPQTTQTFFPQKGGVPSLRLEGITWSAMPQTMSPTQTFFPKSSHAQKGWGPFASSGGYHMVRHAPDHVTDTNIFPKIKPCTKRVVPSLHRHKHFPQNQTMHKKSGVASCSPQWERKPQWGFTVRPLSSRPFVSRAPAKDVNKPSPKSVPLPQKSPQKAMQKFTNILFHKNFAPRDVVNILKKLSTTIFWFLFFLNFFLKNFISCP
jgi:hypothetical protein